MLRLQPSQAVLLDNLHVGPCHRPAARADSRHARLNRHAAHAGQQAWPSHWQHVHNHKLLGTYLEPGQPAGYCQLDVGICDPDDDTSHKYYGLLHEGIEVDQGHGLAHVSGAVHILPTQTHQLNSCEALAADLPHAGTSSEAP